MSTSEQSFIEEKNNENQNLIKVIDILGRDTKKKGFIIKIYDDGSVEKKYIMK